MKQYAIRDVRELDREGGHFSKHMAAMTDEGLHDKAAIAAELAYRDVLLETERERADQFQRAVFNLDENANYHCERADNERERADALNRELEEEHYHRQAVERSEQALAAYVERLHELVDQAAEGDLHPADIAPMAIKDRPETSLARRDAHPDDAAVDRFAEAMKAKLAEARAKGRSGWEDPAQCSGEMLARMLLEHIIKGNSGNFEDIANLAMMLHQRGEDSYIVARLVKRWDRELKVRALDAALKRMRTTKRDEPKRDALDIAIASVEKLRRETWLGGNYYGSV